MSLILEIYNKFKKKNLNTLDPLSFNYFNFGHISPKFYKELRVRSD
jgi:hypothetical protein